jgi:mannan endo-1,4-beta-mannosidase
VWGFGDVTTLPAADATDANKVYFHYLNSTGGYVNYGADGIQCLDYVVSAAEKHKVKLVLPFHLYPNSWGYNYTWGNEVYF